MSPALAGRILTSGPPGKSLYQLLFFIYNFYLFWAVVGLCCYMGFSLVAASRGYSPVVVCRLLIAVAYPVAQHGL